MKKTFTAIRHIIISKFSIILLFISCSLSISAQDTISFFNFDIDAITSWTTGASGINGDSDGRCSWEIAVPQGGQGYNNFFFQWRFEGNSDPVMDHSIGNAVNKVAGQGLGASSIQQGVSGHFVNSSEWIQSPAINCENSFNTTLSFWRWANFEPNSDYAFVEISDNGTTWTQLNHPMAIEDTKWTLVTIDISEYADWKQQVFIRWRSESSAWTYYSGWNIDDVLITGKTTLNDHSSKITNGSINAPITISSLIDTYNERIDISEFSITDMSSGDNLPTIIDTLVVVPGTNNSIEKWRKAIEGAYLYNSGFTSLVNNEIVGTVKNNKIYFTGKNLISIADGSSETYVLRLNLTKNLSCATDNQQFEFEIKYSDQKVNPNGSYIDSGNTTTGSSNLVLDISATELRFISEPEPLQALNREMLPSTIVAATDENGNIDIDFSASVSIHNSAGLAMKKKKITAVNGLATFSTMQFTELGGPVTLSTSHKGGNSISDATSSVQITILENIDNGFYFEDFDNTATIGWTTNATGVDGGSDGRTSWKLGNPGGGQGFIDLGFFTWNVGNPDPKRDVSRNKINNVYGQGLGTYPQIEGVASYYSNSEEWLMSPAIDCKNYYNIQFSFYRWANFEDGYDSAFVEASIDGTNWTKLAHPIFPEDNSWVKVSIDISEIADRQESVYLRWRSVSNSNTQYAGWNIDNVELNGIFSPITEWTGDVSSDWSNVNNWSGGILPDKLSNVSIAANSKNFPVVNTGDATCNQLTIKTGASLTLNSGSSLSVYGDLIIETTSTSYGSLIDNGNLIVYGKGQMSRDIIGNEWQFIASPFSSVNTNLFGSKIYKYNEVVASDNWLYGWEQVANEVMQPGVGYDVFMSNSASVLMEGQFNNGTYSLNITNTNGAETPDHEGWNFVGNPYPSAIDWDAPNGWIKNNIRDAIYLWDKELQNYVTYINGVGTLGGSNIIPPTQGFFIKVNNPGNGTLSMNNNVRVLNTQEKFKSASSAEGLNIKLSSDAYYDETIIRFMSNASEDFDSGLDAEKKFSSNKNVPQIYTKASSEVILAVNTLGSIEEYVQFPIYIKVNSSGNYTLQFEGLYNIDYSKTVYLEDVETGEMINLHETSDYTFSSGRVNNYERFILHVGMPLQITYEVTHVSDINGSDGQVDVTVMGGNLPIAEIIWSDGSVTEDLQNITAGVYSVIVTDANSNSVSETIVVMQPDENGELTSISNNTSTDNELKIFAIDKAVIVESLIPATTIDNINIYDLSGKMIYSEIEKRQGKVSIELPQHCGLFIVKVNYQNKNTSRKVILK